MKNIIKQLFIIISILTLILLCSCTDTPTTDTDTDIPVNKEPITPATIEVLKVGKADCIIINTGSKLVMIDTGEEENVSTVNTYMRLNGYNKIDTLILTHYDKDHIGGAANVISRYTVDNVIETKFEDSTLEYINYHNAMYDKNLTPLKLTENYKFTYDSCEFEITIPQKNKYSSKQDNNTSLIISMKCGDNTFLFAGDAMEERLNEFIAYNTTTYDLVKLPYHGNYLDNYQAFLENTRPKYAVSTDSKKNPTANETLSILKNYSVTTYQTLNGVVAITTDGEKITITQ